MKALYLLLTIPLCRAVINFNSWFYLRKVLIKHDEYVSGINNDSSDEKKAISKKAADWITSNTSEIKRKIKNAGIDNPVIQVMEPAGYGHVAPQAFSILDNILFRNREVMLQARNIIAVGKGYYLTQTKHSINPIYWIEIAFFLPKNIASASGIETTSKISKIVMQVVQIIYWCAIIWAFIFKPELFNFMFDHAKT